MNSILTNKDVLSSLRKLDTSCIHLREGNFNGEIICIRCYKEACRVLLSDLCRRTKPVLSDATPGWVVPGSTTKPREQAMRSQSISNTLQWPLNYFLSTDSCLILFPILTSFNNRLLYGNITQLILTSLKFTGSWYFILATVTLP